MSAVRVEWTLLELYYYVKFDSERDFFPLFLFVTV